MVIEALRSAAVWRHSSCNNNRKEGPREIRRVKSRLRVRDRVRVRVRGRFRVRVRVRVGKKDQSLWHAKIKGPIVSSRETNRSIRHQK